MTAPLRIDLYRLRIPLRQPYTLALATLTHFDTLIVQISDGDRRSGFGEATFLRGYTDERPEASWHLAAKLASDIVDARTTTIEAAVAPHRALAPFTSTAFMTAWEMLTGHPYLDVDVPTRVPLLATVNRRYETGLDEEIEQIVEAGYATVKVKVGFDVERDLDHVRSIQRATRGRLHIRIDANQGFTQEQGIAFASRLDLRDIELFEQPCQAGDWEAQSAVARISRVPLMVDESIYSLEDIERTAELGAARYVKVKLMKFAGLTALARAIRRIRDLGLIPVLGNGVACEPGCWMEACVAARCIDNAGEMNGFLKPSAGLFLQPLSCERGAILLMPGFRPALDPRALEDAAIETRSFQAR